MLDAGPALGQVVLSFLGMGVGGGGNGFLCMRMVSEAVQRSCRYPERIPEKAKDMGLTPPEGKTQYTGFYKGLSADWHKVPLGVDALDPKSPPGRLIASLCIKSVVKYDVLICSEFVLLWGGV